MRKYTKLIVLSLVLVSLITLITLAMIFDADLFLFKNLSIAGIQEKKLAVEELMKKQATEEQNNLTEKENVEKSKNSFDVAKETYENIDDSTITIVQEATKEEKYFIEYLWIVLGNYASANEVSINIITPGSQAASNEATDNSNKETTDATADATADATGSISESITNSNTTTSVTSGIKITVEGRYANVADFVFDVENNKSLRFKLDNIKMNYSGNNRIKATFDVLSLSVAQ